MKWQAKVTVVVALLAARSTSAASPTALAQTARDSVYGAAADTAAALTVLEDAVARIDRLPAPGADEATIRRLAEAFGRSGGPDRALELSRDYEVVRVVVCGCLAQGDTARARELIERSDTPEERDWALVHLAGQQLGTWYRGDASPQAVAAALATARSITLPAPRATALYMALRTMAVSRDSAAARGDTIPPDTEEVRALTLEARTAVREVRDSTRLMPLLRSLVEAEVRAGWRDSALAVASSVPRPDERAGLILQVANAPGIPPRLRESVIAVAVADMGQIPHASARRSAYSWLAYTIRQWGDSASAAHFDSLGGDRGAPVARPGPVDRARALVQAGDYPGALAVVGQLPRDPRWGRRARAYIAVSRTLSAPYPVPWGAVRQALDRARVEALAVSDPGVRRELLEFILNEQHRTGDTHDTRDPDWREPERRGLVADAALTARALGRAAEDRLLAWRAVQRASRPDSLAVTEGLALADSIRDPDSRWSAMANIAVLQRAQRERDTIAARIPVDSVRARVLAARVATLLPSWGTPKPEAWREALPLALEALPMLEPTPYGHVERPVIRAVLAGAGIEPVRAWVRSRRRPEAVVTAASFVAGLLREGGRPLMFGNGPESCVGD